MPILAILASVYLMLNLPLETWVRFIVWMALGFVMYFVYGARHSRLATDPAYAASTEDDRLAGVAARGGGRGDGSVAPSGRAAGPDPNRR